MSEATHFQEFAKRLRTPVTDPVENTAYWLRRNFRTVPKDRRAELLPILGDLQGEIVAQETTGHKFEGEKDAEAFAMEWFSNTIGFRRVENFAGILFDADFRLLDCKLLTSGATTAVAITRRELAEWIFRFPTSLLLLAHNHPSGSDRPSMGDFVLSNEIRQLLSRFQVSVWCYIVARKAVKRFGE
jgi:DNA repair protein RadC